MFYQLTGHMNWNSIRFAERIKAAREYCYYLDVCIICCETVWGHSSYCDEVQKSSVCYQVITEVICLILVQKMR